MKKTVFLMMAAVMAAACTDEPYRPDEPADTTASDMRHALVLCEGSWGGNDASLARVSTASGVIEAEWFEDNNGRGLGDVAQDMVLCGDKAYATVTFSNSLEAIDTATGRSTRHAMGNLHPRFIAAHDGRLYISCYEGHQVVAYDTTDLDNIVATYTLGDYQPEGLAVAGGRLFVASSWIQQQNQQYSYDSTVYVFDLDSRTLVATVPVGLNPQMVQATDGAHVAVNYNGDYGVHAAGCAIIDVATLTVSQLERAATGIATADGVLYAFTRQGYGAGSTASYWRYDGNTTSVIPITLNSPYSISADADGTIYVTTDGNYTSAGDVCCYNADGTLRWRNEAGILPKKVVSLQ